MGRKERYTTHVEPYLDQIREWIQSMSEKQIAERLGITAMCLNNYKKRYPELQQALWDGRKQLVYDLRESLKMKAKGYKYTETKVKTRVTEDGQEITYREEYTKYAQPDTGAIHLLLKNFDDTWHNDDKQTMDLKREQVEIKKKQAESEW